MVKIGLPFWHGGVCFGPAPARGLAPAPAFPERTKTGSRAPGRLRPGLAERGLRAAREPSVSVPLGRKGGPSSARTPPSQASCVRVPGAPRRGVGGGWIAAVAGAVGSFQGGGGAAKRGNPVGVPLLGGAGGIWGVRRGGWCRARVWELLYRYAMEILRGLQSGARARSYRSRGRCRKSYPRVDVDNFLGCLAGQIRSK